MDRMNERFAPNMVAVSLDRYDSLIKAETMLEAMLKEYSRGKDYHIISEGTVKNVRAVIYGIVEDETDA